MLVHGLRMDLKRVTTVIQPMLALILSSWCLKRVLYDFWLVTQHSKIYLVRMIFLHLVFYGPLALVRAFLRFNAKVLYVLLVLPVKCVCNVCLHVALKWVGIIPCFFVFLFSTHEFWFQVLDYYSNSTIFSGKELRD